jgi:hypothetical protein
MQHPTSTFSSGGVMKDMTDKMCGSEFESAMFDYANFEHLEQEGWRRYGQLLAPRN